MRQFGEVRNGHRFKRPPSKNRIECYKATAAAWLQSFGQHQRSGTLPTEISGEATLPACAHAEQLSCSFNDRLRCLWPAVLMSAYWRMGCNENS